MSIDHLETIREGREHHVELIRMQERAAARFARAVRDARDAGVPVADIADAAGITRQGIYKLLGTDTGREDSTRERGNVNYWLVSAGTNEDPEVHDDWRPRRARWIERYGDVWQFRRRPRITPGDRLVSYAVGSARAFGKGRIFSLYEVVSEPEPGEHERWPWRSSCTASRASPCSRSRPRWTTSGSARCPCAGRPTST